MPAIDLSKLSDDELQELIPKIEHELSRRQEDRKREVLQKMKELAESIGTTPEALLKEGRGKARRQQRKGKMYQHPDDPSETWSGRGKRPGWLEQLLESGKTLEELEL